MNHCCPAIQVILAAAIIALVAVKLQDTTWYAEDGKTFDVQVTCALGTAVESGSLCDYVYAVAGISMAVSLAISLLQCCTCNLCGLGSILDLLFAGVGTAWWAIAAAVVQTNVSDASDEDLPLQNYRTSVVVMMWVEVALFALLVLSGIFQCCGSCGGRKNSSKV